MTAIILKHQETIEFLGDGILVIFGAPLARPDDARRAVACAVDVQPAMAKMRFSPEEIPWDRLGFHTTRWALRD